MLKSKIATILSSRFFSNINGNLAIIFSVAVLPIVVSLGAAYDYTRLVNNKFLVQEALDSAVMNAAIEYTANKNEDNAITAGANMFASNCYIPDCTKVQAPAFTVIPGETVSGRVVAHLDTTFMGVIGISQMPYDIVAEVTLSQKTQEYYFLVDVSASLGIGSTLNDIDDLQALTKPYTSPTGIAPDGCAFACHYIDGWEPLIKNQTITTYDWAKGEGFEVREDLMNDAIASTIETILENVTGVHSDQIKVGAYAFSDSLELLTKPTAASTNIRSAIRNSRINKWGTRHDLILPEAVAAIGVSGSGLTRKDRTKTVILITDGVTTDYGNLVSTAMDPTPCQGFKDNGVKVVVINVAYPELTGDTLFEQRVRSFYDDIAPALEECATEGFYYELEQTPQIQAELIKMSKEIIEPELIFTK